MKAVVQDGYGPVERLRVEDVPVPVPGPDQVLVRVRAAGVDPGVWHLVTGRPYAVRPAFGLRRPRSRVPGLDLAGVVESVGAAVRGLSPGDEVYGTGTGSWAELALAPAAKLARKPQSLTFEQAAAVPVSGQTALAAVRDAGRVADGQRVLVIGAGGGVGSYVVQLAKAAGARVTGMCSPGKAEVVRGLGADDVVDYTREEVDDRGPVYDVVIDTAGNRALRLLRRALAAHGTLVLVGGESAGGPWLQGFDRQLRALLVSPFVGQRLVPLMSRESTENLAALGTLVEKGAVRPLVDRTYTLSDAGDALAHLADGHALGKSVLVP